MLRRKNAIIPGALNRLKHEKSPYLLQHVENPVDWHPWGGRRVVSTSGKQMRSTAAYVCRNFSCQRPVTDPKELAAILAAGGKKR